MWKNNKPKLCVVIGGPKRSFIVKELYVGDASLQCYGPSKWVLTKVGNQAKPLKYSEKLHFIPIYSRCTTAQLMAKQQRLTCALKNARLLPQQLGK